MDASGLIRALDLRPHPEGGHYRETFRDPRLDAGGRALSTAILFLLGVGATSEWHRVVLRHAPAGQEAAALLRGPAIVAGQRLQIVVPAGVWQTATSLGAWTLVGCTVAPGFTFDGFELAPPGWRPIPRSMT